MPDDLFGLTGKTALVVGGGLGIGRATAELLSSVGMNVMVLDREEERARGVRDSLIAAGGSSSAIVADILDPATPARAIGETLAAFGELHVLVNVVGFAVRSYLESMTDEEFDLDLSRNLKYVFRFGRALAQAPGSGPRAIVNITSIGALNGSPGLGAYGVAKAGLISLTRTMAVEWAASGVRVNAIAPGSIITDRYQGDPELNAERGKAIPMGRLGKQTEIANAVLFLASDLSSYVTGQTLVVDGGITIRSALPMPPNLRDGQDTDPDRMVRG